MKKIIMLGTGNGGTLDLYNTCFVIQNEHNNFLVDTGGSIEIIKRLKQVNVDLYSVKDIFVSHSHTDHILGLIWLLKKITANFINNKADFNINIYCNDVTYDAIINVSKYLLPKRLIEAINDIFIFHILEDNENVMINGINYRFFDIKAKGTKQFGFECILNNKRLVFLGDEPLNPELKDLVRGADYVMCEAFCLDSEENFFHAYEKHHSTAKNAGEIMNKLDVKNLILYHTEESHGDKRKELYTKEAQAYFDGNIIVPNDLEEIGVYHE